MDTVNLIVNVIGFVGLAWYIWVLKGQIKSQKDILDSQNETIKSMKIYVDIFQPEKIHEFVKMREMTFKDIRDKEIAKIQSDLEERLKKRSDVAKLLFEEYIILSQIILKLTFYVNPELRKAALENVPNSPTKNFWVDGVNKVPYYGDVYANELRRILSENVSFSEQTKVEIKH